MTQTEIKSTVTNKTLYINNLFSKIARKYDLLNNLMTFGMHYKWKEETIKLALQINKRPKEALDLCSGTGDLAIILNKFSPLTKITCVDNCTNMQKIAEAKIKKLHIKNILYLLKDLENLHFEHSSYDLISIGFGLRNLINRENCLEAIFRILKPDGIFACIDLGYPSNSFWQTIYNYYFFKIIPNLGGIFAKDKEAYTYLTNSLLSWYKQEELKELILKSGFQQCFYKNIFGGAVAIHIATK